MAGREKLSRKNVVPAKKNQERIKDDAEEHGESMCAHPFVFNPLRDPYSVMTVSSCS